MDTRLLMKDNDELGEIHDLMENVDSESSEA